MDYGDLIVGNVLNFVLTDGQTPPPLVARLVNIQ